MKVPTALIFLLSLFLWPAAGQGLDLEDAVRGAGDTGREWLVYRVPLAHPDRFLCCYGWRDGEAREGTCRPETGTGSWSTSDVKGAGPGSDTSEVYLAVHRGEVEQVHTYSAGCRVETTWPVRDLTGVAEADSLDVLRGVVLRDAVGESRRRGQALAAIAGHRPPGSVEALADLSAPQRGADLREEAIFWLGQTRSPLAVAELANQLDAEPKASIREQILFSLSQTRRPEAALRIQRAAEQDVSADVRRHSWFCLALTGDPGAEAAILRGVRDDPSADVREGAVFALSQLPSPRSVDALLDLVRRPGDGEVKRQALFWLAQSGDPRAMEKISSLLD
ncbi:MAG: HEAT repeat domain-containing protein [Acidobacteriota bacterium]